MKTRWALLAGAALVAVMASTQACGDPVHDGEVDALGPEPNGSPGPTHRPGQPCLVCHGGKGPASATFTTAGTMYQVKGQPDPLVGATVHLTDAKGGTFDSSATNEVGNFFVRSDEWAPVFPLHVELDYQTDKSPMTTHIGRDASCATCHFDPPGPTTPGRVYLVIDPADLPGASP